ncbi:hypothetical protein Leryth_026623 [Lithospermum erythrorhizon]|nr:hypothetical protein Leryth_026623 [Lithospermum erythrorhizon]
MVRARTDSGTSGVVGELKKAMKDGKSIIIEMMKYIKHTEFGFHQGSQYKNERVASYISTGFNLLQKS